MNRKLTKAMREILEQSIDSSIHRKQLLRADTEDRLQLLQNQEHVATADLVALFHAVMDIQRAQDSIAADRWSLLKF
jgi:hypothetical protein